MPQARANAVPGIHSQPPERAVVPPKRGSFSTIRTLRPRCPAVTAADMPAQPEPTTSASHSYVSCSCALFATSPVLLLEQLAFGFGNRSVGVVALHGLDDVEIVPRLLGFRRFLHPRQIHVPDHAAVLAQPA